MKKLLIAIASLLALSTALLVQTSCERQPPLHLHRGMHLLIPLPVVQLELDVYWKYDVDYDWRAEWTYGWDDEDQRLFGNIGYTLPESFDLRRYYLGDEPNLPHRMVDEFFVKGTTFTTEYKYGYHDLLVWNHISTPDDVLSTIFDEQLDSVMVFTNPSPVSVPYQLPANPRAHYQPEELFAAEERNMEITSNPEDYDYYDPEKNVYYKYSKMTLHPVSYIYLTQVRLHNNRGRVNGVDGEANMSGMARGATLNSGRSSREPVTVHYNVRFKRDCVIEDTKEMVDIAGGRCLTFGITSQNSSRTSRAEDVKEKIRHYMDVHFLFNNGMDSTLVFDVTDQVRRRYKGGVITVDLDVDTVPIPTRRGGSGFDAVVKDYEEETHEIEIKK